MIASEATDRREQRSNQERMEEREGCAALCCIKLSFEAAKQQQRVNNIVDINKVKDHKAKRETSQENLHSILSLLNK